MDRNEKATIQNDDLSEQNTNDGAQQDSLSATQNNAVLTVHEQQESVVAEAERASIGESETKKKKAPIFSTEKLVVMAMFSALAFVVSYLEFPLFPATPFLKLDFGNTFIMLVGFLYGPVEGIISCVCKEALCALFKTQTAGVGELANIIMLSAYIVLPSIVYRLKKGIRPVVISLAVACVLQTAVALLANRFLTFPLYMGDNAASMFESSWLFIILFNLIKAVSVSILTMLLYKRLSKFLYRFRK